MPSCRNKAMLLNADLTRRVLVDAAQYHWVASPQPGVERMMLDRLGGEQARATSIVRYAPQAWYPAHRHPGGEEVLVLSGVFTEGGRDYPAGWYLRNPPGSAHQPSSTQGALIFVKLAQMDLAETQPVRIDTRQPAAWQRLGNREVCPLFERDAEQVSLQRLAPGTAIFDSAVEGAELLVLAGGISTGARRGLGDGHGRGSWMRLPPGKYPEIAADSRGLTVYLKTWR
jgi:anti-sigma factor ChrR (cupin superfamily)